MSARRAHAPPLRGEAVIRDADALRLLPPTNATNKNALALLLWLKANARGQRFLVARNDTLVNELGWSPATLKRAKRRLRAAGLTVDELRERGRGDFKGAARYVLDRRWIVQLRGAGDEGQGCTEVRSELTGSKEEKTPLTTTNASLGGGGERAGPPRGSPTPPEGVVEPSSEQRSADVVGEAEPQLASLPPLELCEPALSEMRAWVARRCELGDEPGFGLLKAAARWARHRSGGTLGASMQVTFAQMRLAHELGVVLAPDGPEPREHEQRAEPTVPSLALALELGLEGEELEAAIERRVVERALRDRADVDGDPPAERATDGDPPPEWLGWLHGGAL